ncbi:uncharacterized protein FIBRA_01320 [Fibroporia radiculosa]|uniref:COQ9 C-terminal domain-containing protein n=1 Tax=Fibroporia radiculosa TaxID=599839 RepID=J4H114_9APHY|nr:uncharacterized protein FIBRA_01320 [Fibroporia radiculosa]CCL99304.1 predicted protein [Fibroporia radiculosa]
MDGSAYGDIVAQPNWTRSTHDSKWAGYLKSSAPDNTSRRLAVYRGSPLYSRLDHHTMSRAQLLKLALPLVKTHGFTREALSRSVLYLPGTPHAEPLSETAISALFGDGDNARRTLLDAWLDDARTDMKSAPSPIMKDVLASRLRRNEPILRWLPEAFGLLISPPSGVPPLDPSPALKHVASIADEACHIVGDTSLGLSWYARRASVAAVYGAAELHQLASPATAYEFLESLLSSSSNIENTLVNTEAYAKYIGRSWAGIIKSSGVF